jgi:hypothetical protein
MKIVPKRAAMKPITGQLATSAIETKRPPVVAAMTQMSTNDK